MARTLRPDGRAAWVNADAEDERTIRTLATQREVTLPTLPGPLAAHPHDRFKAPWAARGGELDVLLVELQCPAVGRILRRSLADYCRRMAQDRRAPTYVRDLTQDYLTGTDHPK